MAHYIPIAENTPISQGDYIRQPQSNGSYRYIRIGHFDYGQSCYQVFVSDKDFEKIGFAFFYCKEDMIAQKCEKFIQ